MSASIPTLVVDDEPLARRRMLRLLRADPDITSVGTIGSATEAPAAEAGAAGAARWPSLAAGRTRLLLSERGKVVVLAMRDIEFVQAAAKHVKIYASGRCFSFRQSLAQLEGRLAPASFVRIHRST